MAEQGQPERATVQVRPEVRDDLKVMVWQMSGKVGRKVTQNDLISILLQIGREHPDRMEELFNQLGE